MSKLKHFVAAAAFVLLSGVASPALADAIDDLAPGTWHRVPSSKLDDLNPCPNDNCTYSGVIGFRGVISAWSGAAFDTTRNRLLIWGGGHRDYFGNEVYAFDTDTLQWSQLTNPSSNVGGSEASGLYPDGTPRARHTYNTIAYSPEIDSLLGFGAPGTGPNSNRPDSILHRLPLSGNPPLNGTPAPWTQMAPVAPSGTRFGVTAYDPNRNAIWYQGSHSGGQLGKFSPSTNSWQTYADKGMKIYATARIDPTRDKMLVLGGTNTGQIFVWDLSNPNAQPMNLLNNSTYTSTNQWDVHGRQAPGLDYDPIADRFVVWDGGATVYTIHPDTWAVQRVTPAAGNTVVPPQAANNGTYGRFRYVPSRNAFVVVNSIYEDVYFYRLAPGGGSTPSPSVTIGASPSTVTSGGSSTISWNALNADTCTASGAWSGSRPTSGTFTATNVTSNRTYTLTCQGDGGSDTESVTVTVDDQSAPTVDLSASSSSILEGGTVVLSWTSGNANSCTARGDWSGSRPTSGAETMGPLVENSEFILDCENGAGVTTDSVTVIVSPQPTDDYTILQSSDGTHFDPSLLDGTTVSGDLFAFVSPDTGVSQVRFYLDDPDRSGSPFRVENVAPYDFQGGLGYDTSQLSDGAHTITAEIDRSGGGMVVVTVSFIVRNESTVPQPTLNFSAEDASVDYGDFATLTWTSTDTESCEASGDWSGSRATDGSESVGPLTEDSTFFLTCTGAGGSITQPVTVLVAPPPQPSVSVSASPASVPYEGSTLVSWTSSNATACAASGDWSGSRPPNGSATVGPLVGDADFTLTCTGPGGSDTDTASVTVGAPPTPTLSLSATPNPTNYNGASTLTWSSSNATSCSASGGWSGSQPVAGSVTVGPLTSDTTYSLTCSGVGGNVTRDVTVAVNPAPLPQIVFSANPTAVDYQAAAILNWSVSNATSCTASGGWSGPRAVSGSESTPPLTDDTNFVLSCSGPGGSDSETVTVTVGAAPQPVVTIDATPGTVDYNGAAQLSWSATNAASCTASGGWSGARPVSGTLTVGPLQSDTTYELTCTGPGGNGGDSVTVVVNPPAPTVTISAVPEFVEFEGSSTLVWSSTDADSCVASGDWSGPQPVSGSTAVGPLTADATYTLTCSGAGGDGVDSAVITVAAAGEPSLSVQATPAEVAAGGNSTIAWTAANVDTCTASGDWSGPRGLTGSETVGPLSADATFVLSCDGPAGSIVRQATVTIAASSPTVSLDAAPGNVDYGGGTTLTWSTSGADACTAFGGWSGTRPTSGSETISGLTDETTFALVCTGPGGDGNDTVTVTVNAAPQPAVSLQANPTAVDAGDSTTLTWSTQFATDCEAAGAWSGSRATSGTETVGPLNADASFSLICSGPGGQGTASVEVDVQTSAPTLSIGAAPESIGYGGSTTVSWSTSDADMCTAFGAWSGPQPVSGSAEFTGLTENSVYFLLCSGPGGSVNDSVEVTVSAPPQPDVTLIAAPSTVDYNQTTTLSWTSDNASSCEAFGAWSGTRDTDGVEVVGPLTADSDFVLVCDGPGGSQVDSVEVSVTLPPSPEILIAATPDSIPLGDTAQLTWAVAYAETCTASGDWSGDVDIDGSQVVGPLFTTSTYTLTCTGGGGSSSRSVSVNVASAAQMALQDFSAYGSGSPVPGWFQTGDANSLTFAPLTFSVRTQDANQVMALDKVGFDYHNHYLQSQSDLWRDYRYTGRLYVSSPSDRLGVTFLSAYPQEDAYYRLAYESNGGAFRLSARGTTCNGDLGTGVVPTVGTWYRYNIEAESTGGATAIRARVWEDGSPEPTVWQAQCTDSSASRRQFGTVGLWGSRANPENLAHWDDLLVAPVDSDAVFPPTLNFTATPPVVAAGGVVSLAWSSTNADGCTASDGWTGARSAAGNETVGPLQQDISFTLTCSGPGGSVSRVLAVDVVDSSGPPVVSLSAEPELVPTGGSTTLSWSATDAAVCAASGGWSGVFAPSGSQVVSGIDRDTVFQLNCIGPGGNVAAEVQVLLSDVPRDPELQLSVDFSRLPVDNMVTLLWESTYTFGCTASGSWSGDRPSSGLELVGPIEVEEVYELTCEGNGGTVSATAVVNYVDSDQDGMPDVWEMQYFGGLDNNGLGDTDGDGLADAGEYIAGTNPLSIDTDGDGATDLEEIEFGSDPRDGTDVFESNRPQRPTLEAFQDAPLWGFVADVTSGYLDPDGDALAYSEWQFSLNPSFTALVFSREVPGKTSVDIPAGVLDPGVGYFVRTRHIDSRGIPSDWSLPAGARMLQSYPNDADGNGVDDTYQPPANADANGNGVVDGDEGLCNLYDAEGFSLVGFETNSGVIRCYRSVPTRDIEADGVEGDTPFGFFSWRVEGLVVNPQEPAQVFVTVWLPEGIENEAGWVVYDRAGAELIDYSDNATANGNRVIIRYTDGGTGDEDGVVNGVIVDPSGPLVPPVQVAPPPPPPAPTPSTDSSDGGGGSGSMAPLGLLVLGGLVLGRRRRLAA